MQAINLGFAHPKVEDRVTLTLPELEGLLAGTDRDVPSSALTSVGPFEFHAYWYNRRYLAGVDTIGNQKQVRELQRKWSGILLFRDGFRVFPYGDDEDDWLGLDRRALGRTGYVLNKAQFVGHVQITRAKNARLVDQTNREGLRANPEQQVFTSTLQHVVRDALWDFFREVERQYKKVPLDIAELTADVDKLENRARSALSQVRKLVPREELAIVEDLQMAFTEFREISHRARVRIEEVESESRQMIHMAGLGLMVEVVAHELARAAESAMEALEGLRGRDMPAEVKGRLETLRAEMKTVSKRLRVLDELSVSGRQRAEVFDLGEVLDDLKEGHAGQFQRHNIRVVMERPSGVLRVRLVKGMLVQILENLISNSVYWMKIQAARPVHYGPTITLRVQTSPFVICYSDNGPGISPDHREKIFRPFWSLKEKGKRRGLGLFIARENAVHLGATLSLSDASDPMTHRLHEFVLAFPSSPLVS
jgi:signal transduction histidine kinase